MAAVVRTVTAVNQVDGALRADIDPWQQAAVDALTALDLSAARLRDAFGDVDPSQPRLGAAPVRHLAAAADGFAATADLLVSHIGTDRNGASFPRSPWAAVLATPLAARGVIVEIGDHLESMAALAHQLAAATRPAGVQRAALTQTGQLLLSAATSTWTATGADPATPRTVALLHAIPAASWSGAVDVPTSGNVPQLCEAVTESAQRVATVTFRAGRLDDPLAWFTAATWSRRAKQAAITSHLAGQVCYTISNHLLGDVGSLTMTADADLLGGVSQRLRDAAGAWAAVEVGWQDVYTALPAIRPAMVADLDQLLTGWGRLAYRDPQWKIGHDQQPRRGADLADGEHFRPVLAAVHHSVHTLAGLAETDQANVAAVARQGGLFVPTRSLPEGYDVPYRLAPIVAELAQPLHQAYQHARDATAAAADHIAGLAAGFNLPSTVLTDARRSVQAHHDHLARDPLPAVAAPPSRRPGWWAGPVEQAARELGAADPVLLLRAAGIDAAGRVLIDQAASTREHGVPERGVPVTGHRRPPRQVTSRRQPPQPLESPATSPCSRRSPPPPDGDLAPETGPDWPPAM